MRVLLFHPWGRFDPAFCGAGYTACAHLNYFQQRGWDVHCVMQEIPAWGFVANNTDEIASRFACVKSIRTIRVDCPPVAPRRYGDEFRQLLYASERAARSAAFREIVREPWHAFFTTDVTAAPYALALPRSVRKILATGDSYARRAATAERTPRAMSKVEEQFAFSRIEVELYRFFDRVMCGSEEDARRVRRYGINATCIPPLMHEPGSFTSPEVEGEHDLLIHGGARSGELADAEWFYRHVYLPYLRACGVCLTLAGPVAERFPVNDLSVTKLPSATNASARVVVAPACEAPWSCVSVLESLAAGRTLVTTPLAIRGIELSRDAACVIDMRRAPNETTVVIRGLLANPPRRRELGEHARQVCDQYTRGRFFAALDAMWGSRAQQVPPKALASRYSGMRIERE